MPLQLKKYFSKHFKISALDIIEAIKDKELSVNGIVPDFYQLIDKFDTILYRNKLIQSGKQKLYIAYYKPRGIESTLSTRIPNSLASELHFQETLFPLGRLDKESEGLMILTNDGSIYNKITHADSLKEKEYVVQVDKPLTENALLRLRSGIEILGKVTNPCEVWKENDTLFHIILKQGMNRQIRRMCYKLNYEVVRLVRVRIADIRLDQLEPGQYRILGDVDFYCKNSAYK